MLLLAPSEHGFGHDLTATVGVNLQLLGAVMFAVMVRVFGGEFGEDQMLEGFAFVDAMSELAKATGAASPQQALREVY